MRKLLGLALMVGFGLVAATPAAATFPGKNGKIIFWEPPIYLTTFNPDGTGQTRLFDERGFYLEASGPAWSPDGTRLALHCPFFFGGPGSLCTTDANGKDKQFIDVPGGGSPAWSPDGDRLAYGAASTVSCCATAVWVTDLDGTDQKMLSPYGLAPDWSPDGKKIAFYDGAPPDRFHNGDLYVMNADGSGITQLTDTDIGREFSPSWSPDASKIAYIGSKTNTRTTPLDVWVMNPDGTDKERITDNQFPDNDHAVVWSPDGRKLAVFGSSPPGYSVMNADGTNREGLGVTAGSSAFDWQPIPGPRRGDFKNAAQFCKAERDFWGEDFAERYGGGANAFGKCVSQTKG